MKKTLILVRHAHRDTSDRDADNGLSSKGQKQAARIIEKYKTIYSDRLKSIPVKEIRIISSRKTRCMETVAQFAEFHQQPLKTDPLLIEQLPNETERDLNRRISEFVKWWKDEAPLWVVACSHGDWLPLAADKLTGRWANFEKSAVVEYSLSAEGVEMICQFSGKSSSDL